jgi:hypothetical protein
MGDFEGAVVPGAFVAAGLAADVLELAVVEPLDPHATTPSDTIRATAEAAPSLRERCTLPPPPTTQPLEEGQPCGYLLINPMIRL